jgi:hypothetical protein
MGAIGTFSHTSSWHGAMHRDSYTFTLISLVVLIFVGVFDIMRIQLLFLNMNCFVQFDLIIRVTIEKGLMSVFILFWTNDAVFTITS